MEQKQLIIIGIICIVICILAGAIFGILTNTVNYEKIELTANGTTIEIPTTNMTYQGVINDSGIKLWTFKQGRLISYNSEEALSGNGIYGLAGAIAFKDVKDLVFNHFKKQEKVDEFIVYTLDANVMDPDGKGDIYCIMLGDNGTHDNILVVASSQDIALHMAKSVQYKVSNSTTASSSNNTVSTNGGGSNTADDKLIPVKYDDGTVAYFHAGDIMSRPNGYYRVNADGSLTKVASDPDNVANSESSSSSDSHSDSDSGSSDNNPTPSPTPASDSNQKVESSVG